MLGRKIILALGCLGYITMTGLCLGLIIKYFNDIYYNCGMFWQYLFAATVMYVASLGQLYYECIRDLHIHVNCYRLVCFFVLNLLLGSLFITSGSLILLYTDESCIKIYADKYSNIYRLFLTTFIYKIIESGILVISGIIILYRRCYKKQENPYECVNYTHFVSNV